MTDPDSQRTKRMPQFYCQDLADETASRRQFVDLLFIDHDVGERRLQIYQKLSSAPKKWLRARFEMGGAYLNFELEIHIDRFILKIFKKYHENQRKKLILTKYV